MAERISAVDPAVDELRRKARRRLVGAIVLALAAAVILPMLLEKEPRPLGEDVSVRIPPVDQDKFVNRLSPGAAKGDTAPAPTGSNPAPAPQVPPPTAPSAKATTPVATEQATPPSSASAPAESAKSEAPPPVAEKPAEPTATAARPAEVAKAEPAVPPKVEPKVETKAVPKSPAAEASSTAKAKPPEGAYVVQLAAFSDDKGANALAAKLKRNGYPAYTEAVRTSRGTLYRVRVGGYPSREAAGEARTKLKGDGYAGIVASAH